MMKFPCTLCGNCCRSVGKQIEFARLAKDNGGTSPIIDEILSFPYKVDETGACEKLVDNKCSVYEDRPDICNVNKIYDKYGKDLQMSLKQWHKLNIRACEMNKGG